MGTSYPIPAENTTRIHRGSPAPVRPRLLLGDTTVLALAHRWLVQLGKAVSPPVLPGRLAAAPHPPAPPLLVKERGEVASAYLRKEVPLSFTRRGEGARQGGRGEVPPQGGLENPQLPANSHPLPLSKGEGGRGYPVPGGRGNNNTTITLLDCGGFFDVYRVALEARRLGADPHAVLERIMVCRAFTAYQMLRALLNLRRTCAPGQRLLLLEPLHPLGDEDLPAEDRPWLFRRLLDAVAWYGSQGVHVQICQRSAQGSHSRRNGQHGGPTAQLRTFEQTLARRFPPRLASRGRIYGVSHGQEREPLFPRDRTGADPVRGLPPLPAQGRPGALRHAV